LFECFSDIIVVFLKVADHEDFVEVFQIRIGDQNCVVLLFWFLCSKIPFIRRIFEIGIKTPKIPNLKLILVAVDDL